MFKPSLNITAAHGEKASTFSGCMTIIVRGDAIAGIEAPQALVDRPAQIQGRMRRHPAPARQPGAPGQQVFQGLHMGAGQIADDFPAFRAAVMRFNRA